MGISHQAFLDEFIKIAIIAPSQPAPSQPRMSSTRRGIAKGVAVGGGLAGAAAGAKLAPGMWKVPAAAAGLIGGAGAGLVGSILALSPGSGGRLRQKYQQRMAARQQGTG